MCVCFSSFRFIEISDVDERSSFVDECRCHLSGSSKLQGRTSSGRNDPRWVQRMLLNVPILMTCLAKEELFTGASSDLITISQRPQQMIFHRPMCTIRNDRINIFNIIVTSTISRPIITISIITFPSRSIIMISSDYCSGVTGGGAGEGGRPRTQVKRGRKMSLPIYILLYLGVKWSTKGTHN